MMKTDVPAMVACRWCGLQICSGCAAKTNDGSGKKRWRESEIEQEGGLWRRKVVVGKKTRQIAF